MLVTTQGAGGGAAESAAQQMARVAAATGNASAMAAAASVESASSSASGVVAGGVPVRLKDVATVRQGYKEREAIIRMRSEEHTSELQSLMRISYAVFCLKKKKNTSTNTN